MKKTLIFFMVLVMSFSVSISAFAAPNGFTVSPGANMAPELVEYDKDTLDCLATLIITAYADRFTLPEETRLVLEKAYADIVAADDLSTLTSELATVANALGVDTGILAVSDLFDISFYGCDDHENHGGFSIKVKPESLQGFVGLLHLKDGKWDVVDDAKVEADGEHLTFSVDSLSPFAIVVQSDEGSEKPPHSGDSLPWGAIFMFVAATAVLGVVVAGSKKKA